jgi:spermidine synthase
MQAPLRESRTPEWLDEVIGDGEIHRHRIDGVVARMSLAGAEICVAQTSYGRALVKNGRLQSTELDEWIYHEALVHPAMIAHPGPRSVLCVGGTTGAIAREVLKHKTVREVMVVWVDPKIVEALDGHLPYVERAILADERVRSVEASPLNAATMGSPVFDVVVADPPEPSESGTALEDVYQHVVASAAGLLGRDGILAIAGGAVHPVKKSISTLPEAMETARRHFAMVDLGIAVVPSLGIPWGMLHCSANHSAGALDAESVDRRLAERGVAGLRFYDGASHLGMYSAPKHVRAWLSASGRMAGRKTG